MRPRIRAHEIMLYRSSSEWMKRCAPVVAEPERHSKRSIDDSVSHPEILSERKIHTSDHLWIADRASFPSRLWSGSVWSQENPLGVADKNRVVPGILRRLSQGILQGRGHRVGADHHATGT